MIPELRRVAACVVATAALVACSGDDAPADEPEAATITPSTVAATPGSTTTSTTPSTTTSSTAAPSTAVAESYDEWCALSRQAEELSGEASRLFQSGPDGAREYVDRIGELVAAADRVVPDALADAWAVSVQMSETVRAAIEAADYDILTTDLSAAEELAEADAAASDAIDAFNAEFCGIEPGPDDDDGDGFDPSLGTLKEQFIDSLVTGGFTLAEAECVFENFDFAAADTIAERDAIEAALDACGIPPERVADLVAGDEG